MIPQILPHYFLSALWSQQRFCPSGLPEIILYQYWHVLKKFTCGGRVGPEHWEEGCGTEGQTTRLHIWGKDGQRNNGASKTPAGTTNVNTAPFASKAQFFFQKGQHESIISKQPFSGVKLTSICMETTVWFVTDLIFTFTGLAHGESLTFGSKAPLSVLPGAVAPIWIDLAGQGHSGHRSHLHIEVMKEDSVPQQTLLQPQLQRWGGTQGTRWLASEETFTQLARAALALLEVAVPACLTRCCPRRLSSAVKFCSARSARSLSGCITD